MSLPPKDASAEKLRFSAACAARGAARALSHARRWLIMHRRFVDERAHPRALTEGALVASK
jgi:hypothetical protein